MSPESLLDLSESDLNIGQNEKLQKEINNDSIQSVQID